MSRLLRQAAIFIAIGGGLLDLALSLLVIHRIFGNWGVLLSSIIFSIYLGIFPILYVVCLWKLESAADHLRFYHGEFVLDGDRGKAGNASYHRGRPSDKTHSNDRQFRVRQHSFGRWAHSCGCHPVPLKFHHGSEMDTVHQASFHGDNYRPAPPHIHTNLYEFKSLCSRLNDPNQERTRYAIRDDWRAGLRDVYVGPGSERRIELGIYPHRKR